MHTAHKSRSTFGQYLIHKSLATLDKIMYISLKLTEALGSSWDIPEGEAEFTDIKPVDVVGGMLVDAGRPLENSSFTVP